MVSKNKYYERKEAGLCTKCGDPLDGESVTRCMKCYDKFKENIKKSKKGDSPKKCLICGTDKNLNTNNYCSECNYKKNISPQPIIKYNNNYTKCRVCDNEINTVGILCKTCLNSVKFTKIEAISRYGTKCCSCNETNSINLRIASIDISQPMDQDGPELFKAICFSKNPPKEYRSICHQCYWTENMQYLKGLRTFFENKTPNSEESIIDVNDFEVTDEH